MLPVFIVYVAVRRGVPALWRQTLKLLERASPKTTDKNAVRGALKAAILGASISLRVMILSTALLAVFVAIQMLWHYAGYLAWFLAGQLGIPYAPWRWR